MSKNVRFQSKAGVAEVEITPRVGVYLSGGIRARKSKGVDDPLYAKALLLNSGNDHVAIVALDLIAICRLHVEAACDMIRERTGIPRRSVLVCTSHTHSGPYTTTILDPRARPDETYMEMVSSKIADAVSIAHKNLEPIEVGFGTTTVKGITENRRLLTENGSAWNRWLLKNLPLRQRKNLKPAGPVDEELQVLAVKDLNARIRAIVFNYPLHANIHFGDNISSDYPGRVSGLISEKMKRKVVTLFIPGACGDINRKLGVEMNDVSKAITSGILNVIERMRFIDRMKMCSAIREIALPLRCFSHFREHEIYQKWPEALPVFKSQHKILARSKETEVKTVVHAFRINDAAFVGVPGELFCQLGLNIKTQSPFKYNFLSELANDFIGYIPTSEAFKQGGYETFHATSAKVADGSGERIVQESLELLKTLAID